MLEAKWRWARAVLAVLGGMAMSGETRAEELVIGVINPFTGPGADLGISSRQGLEPAVEEINRAGGVLGRQIKLVFRDDESNPQKAVAAARELAQRQKAVVIVGANLTHVAMAVSPVINQLKLPFMVMGTGNAVIDPKTFPYSFRTSVSNDIEAAVVVDYVSKRFKAPGIIVDATAYGQSGESSLRKHLTEHGMKPVAVEKFNLSDIDMTGQVNALKEAGADVMLVWGLGGPLAYLARSADRAGFHVPAFGGLGVHQVAFPNLAGAAGKDWSATTYRAFSRALRTDSITPQERAYLDAQKKRWGSELGASVEVNALWEDTLRLLVDAIKRANSTDPDAIKAALEQTSGFKGMVSTYSFGPAKHDAMERSAMTIAYATGVEDHIKTRIPDAP